MDSLGEESERLKALHPDRAGQIETKKREAEQSWANLKQKAADRKAGLGE